MRVSRSLTIKQMATVSSVAVVTICIFIVIQLFHFVQQRRIDYAQQMENVAHTVRQPLSQAVLKADIPQAEFILNSLRPAGILARAEVVLPNGLQALHTDFEPEKPVPRFIMQLFELPVEITVPLYSVQPANPKPLAYLVLQADSWRVYQFILSAVSTMVTAYLLLALILSVSISWCINRLMVRPLRNISRELQDLSLQQAMGHQLPLPRYHRDDEIGMLIRHYNRNQQMIASSYDEISHTSSVPPLSSQRRLDLEYDILQSLEQQQFALWLQPQIDMNTGQLVGAEALLRQRQADGSWSLPEELITRAEENGVITALGRWVFEASCRILAEWQQQGIGLPLSVNLSAIQLHEASMVSFLQELIQRYRILPGSLMLEITETAQIGEPEQALQLLQELKKIGVSIALDDFGMGYANLNWLNQFKALPISKLKIDRSFVAALPNDDTMVRIVAFIADIMTLDVVAEGVETEEQRDWLLVRGVHIGQGYLYSEALPLAQFTQRYLPQS
ncbi:EAL domain-containing protein [Erwinia sorbitola]|uniref:EAL domain-containing protein n=2 Tax=Erwinia sorbitola TaxID=2681984 RepID=A0A6I6EAN1_9GAMM|nr:EAL domain-containing protein [Erwinia sorbitola]MTD28096.1 EAL domain-containing protein [Erwinia sorbitola]QGU85788.1 EAL domain-containing protein [Erwinia sorbitola]